ncbi:uncharacterized protein METZ01_LOCUS94853 [marine metagenome]|uniref:Uncharacterized protein n=1 Tax=marine metagenome TaxID=408172 RepID=A0A381VNV6_9ZZZZ
MQTKDRHVDLIQIFKVTAFLASILVLAYIK